MSSEPHVIEIYRGWDGHREALIDAVRPLTLDQLDFSPGHGLRSVRELVQHIAYGGHGWLERILKDDAANLIDEVSRALGSPEAGADASRLVEVLEASWRDADFILNNWTAADLQRTYIQPYQGKQWIVPYQWVIWRILSHDQHHGGELALALGLQGIEIADLGDQGGHLTQLREAES